MIGTEDRRCQDLSAIRAFQETLGNIVVPGILSLDDR